MLSSAILLLCSLISVISAQGDAVKGAEGCGCGAGPIAPLRNPYVCTSDQLRRAAIALTNQIESYLSPYNPSALFNFVPPYTELVESIFVGNTYCCQETGDIFKFFDRIPSTNRDIVFINQVPMSAVVSEIDCTVRVYATMVTYSIDGGLLATSQQVAFVWKPLCQGQVIPDCNCNLELLRIEVRSPFCNFNEPQCRETRK